MGKNLKQDYIRLNIREIASGRDSKALQLVSSFSASFHRIILFSKRFGEDFPTPVTLLKG